ncbi:DUF932 domain-containing protein [Variovorax boronicumulans]|uniref:DUF932 domain-containing protein n=1 Tax=Variovorax boronicumulans TaxID=436515 RepID=UPI000A44D8A7
MAHLIEKMAYVGQTPWHELGNQLPSKQPLEVWARQAGMDWRICETPVRYITEQAGALGSIRTFEEQKVLYRSDTKAPLSVVGGRYQIVQPREVLEFYRDLTEVSGFELETAGVLKAGKKFWALARTGKETALKGNDTVKGYILLATSCDGTLATTATPTTVRVVCNNTLSIALNGASSAVRVPKSRGSAEHQAHTEHTSNFFDYEIHQTTIPRCARAPLRRTVGLHRLQHHGSQGSVVGSKRLHFR